MDFSLPAAIGLVTTLLGGTPAAIDATPKSLVEALYAQPIAETALAPADVYSTRLQTLFADYVHNQQAMLIAASDAPPPIELIPFDPLTLLSASGPVTLSEPVVDGQQALAIVSMSTHAGPTQLSLFLVEQADGWRIDDVASFSGGGQPWLLSWVLRYDPPIDG